MNNKMLTDCFVQTNVMFELKIFAFLHGFLLSAGYYDCLLVKHRQTITGWQRQ